MIGIVDYGAGDLEQIFNAIEIGKADAVLVASLLHYIEYTVLDIKKDLKRRGVNIR